MGKFDIRKIPQKQLVAFYGLPYAASAADGSIDKEELLVIFENLDFRMHSAVNRVPIKTWTTNTPALRTKTH